MWCVYEAWNQMWKNEWKKWKENITFILKGNRPHHHHREKVSLFPFFPLNSICMMMMMIIVTWMEPPTNQPTIRPNSIQFNQCLWIHHHHHHHAASIIYQHSIKKKKKKQQHTTNDDARCAWIHHNNHHGHIIIIIIWYKDTIHTHTHNLK